MEEHRRTSLDARGLVVGATWRPWWCATVHYWRLPRAGWDRALAALRGLGLTLVEVPVPWGVHERSAGGYDFTGDRDLGGFIDAAAAAGLGVVAQLGPLVDGELTGAGLPERIVRDPDMWARGGHGGPVWIPQVPRAFPLPSLASARFGDEVARWHAAVAAVLAPRRGPDGAVVALGLDGGLAHLVRGGAYDLDYHPDAIAAWRGTGADRDPPRRWSTADADACVAWLRFTRGIAGRALAGYAAGLAAAGLDGLALVGGAAPIDPTHDDAELPWPRQVDLASGTTDPAVVVRRLAVAGAPALVRLPAGHSPLFAPTTGDQRTRLTLAALAAGARGATWTMGVARDRWIGGLVDTDGAVTDEGRRVAAVIAAADRHELMALRRPVDVAVVAPRADARVGVASSLAALVPPAALELVRLGPGGAAELAADPEAAPARRWFDAVLEALALGQVAFAVVDERADLATLPAKAFVTPTLGRVDRRLWRALQALGAARRVVVVGPTAPTRDELDQPLGADAALPRRAGLMRAGCLDDVAGLAADLAALAPRDEWIALRPAGVSTSVFLAHDGRVRAVFVDNRSARAARAVLAVPVDAQLHDAMTDAAIPVAAGQATVDVPAGALAWLAVR
ncbi:MAG: beta-galactosidase [Kofleriaceae bacterium]